VKKGFDAQEVVKVIEAEGRIPKVDQLSRRVRQFSDGLVVGTKEVLEQVFEQQRSYFSAKRKSGARKMREGEWGNLRAMRDLKAEKPKN
jgi:putative transposase